jgi:hypothetical protein
MEATDMELTTQQPYKQHDTSFDVVAAFSGLETARKMTLFDQLMCGRANAYRNTLKSIWPQSNDNDARKLEIILRARLDRLKKFS